METNEIISEEISRQLDNMNLEKYFTYSIDQEVDEMLGKNITRYRIGLGFKNYITVGTIKSMDDFDDMRCQVHMSLNRSLYDLRHYVYCDMFDNCEYNEQVYIANCSTKDKFKVSCHPSIPEGCIIINTDDFMKIRCLNSFCD